MAKRQSAIMRLPRYQLAMLLVACLFFTISSVTSASAIDGFNLAVGEWDVALRGGWNLDATNIFPVAEQPRSLLSLDPTKLFSDKSRAPAPLPLKRRPWGKELDCTLVISADGTFEIHPQSVKSNSNSRRMPIRGKWNVLNNPYCATDRLYDQLTMQSYPRVQTSKSEPQQYLQTVGMTLHCRMWGRFNTGGIFRQWRQYGGKLTHGTCVWREYDVSPEAKLSWWRVRRPVVASFSALRPKKQPSDHGGEDESLFGY
jgi:hypothetical protein